MSERPETWNEWEGMWQSAGVRATDSETAERLFRQQRAQRWFVAAEIIQVSIVASGLLLLFTALRHAANTVEGLLGVGVSVAITVVWVVHTLGRRQEYAAVIANAVQHLDAIRLVRLRQLRLVRFVWTVIGVELLFLALWWAGGVRFHAHELGSPIALATLWAPVAAIVCLIAWTLALRRGALSELQRIEHLRHDFSIE